jgi:hypothetical protein
VADYQFDSLSPTERPVPPTAYGIVYLIDGGDLHKIGRSTNVAQRLTQLQMSSPVVLKVVCLLETVCMQQLEQQLHRAFKARRVYGEWFRLSLDDIAEIVQHPLSDKHDPNKPSKLYEAIRQEHAERKLARSRLFSSTTELRFHAHDF